jgi:hypothetical protein
MNRSFWSYICNNDNIIRFINSFTWNTPEIILQKIQSCIILRSATNNRFFLKDFLLICAFGTQFYSIAKRRNKKSSFKKYPWGTNLFPSEINWYQGSESNRYNTSVSRDFESRASTSSATLAYQRYIKLYLKYVKGQLKCLILFKYYKNRYMI